MVHLLNMRLGTKVVFGFGLLLIMLAVISCVGFKSLSIVVSMWNKADNADGLVKTILETRRHEKNYIIRSDESYVKKVDELTSDFRKRAEAAGDKSDSAQEREWMKQAAAEHDAYGKAFHAYVDSKKEQDAALADMETKSRAALAETEAILADQKAQFEQLMKNTSGEGSEAAIEDRRAKTEDANRMAKWFLEARVFEKEYIASGDGKLKAEVETRAAKVQELGMNLRSRFKQQTNVAQVEKVIASVQAYGLAFSKFTELAERKKTADQNMVNSARAVQEICDKARVEFTNEMERSIDRAKTIIMSVSGFALVFGAIFSFLLTKSITKPLRLIMEGLSTGAARVSGTSSQISATSMSLAEGASQQAAALEETSSSLEELSSMTRRNADHSNLTNRLMGETEQTVGDAKKSMNELMESMSEISGASEEISKIIKTIDEIAFQTNLLALNAAVEAARAGEAGAGFAVVADEVRSLSKRSAEAARHTETLIQATVLKIDRGLTVVGKTSGNISRVAEGASRMVELVTEIAAASNEQAQGIEQISKAVNEMDQVVQQNAANSEEAASAVEEMNVQAIHMKSFVASLEAMVGGSGNGKIETIAEQASSRPGTILHPARLR
jgi:methyl-accepting chemotaxis protein